MYDLLQRSYTAIPSFLYVRRFEYWHTFQQLENEIPFDNRYPTGIGLRNCKYSKINVEKLTITMQVNNISALEIRKEPGVK